MCDNPAPPGTAEEAVTGFTRGYKQAETFLRQLAVHDPGAAFAGATLLQNAVLALRSASQQLRADCLDQLATSRELSLTQLVNETRLLGHGVGKARASQLRQIAANGRNPQRP